MNNKKEIELKDFIEYISNSLGITMKEAEQKVIDLQNAMNNIPNISKPSIDDVANGLNRLGTVLYREITLVDTSRTPNPSSRQYKPKKYR